MGKWRTKIGFILNKELIIIQKAPSGCFYFLFLFFIILCSLISSLIKVLKDQVFEVGVTVANIGLSKFMLLNPLRNDCKSLPENPFMIIAFTGRGGRRR